MLERDVPSFTFSCHGGSWQNDDNAANPEVSKGRSGKDERFAAFKWKQPQQRSRREGWERYEAPQTAADAGPLTPRELEVLRMMAEGAANKTIAWKLGISEHTVKFHVASILVKLGAGTRTEAVTIGIRKGLVLI